MASKERLDVLVYNRDLAPSREKAKAFIMAGCVYVNGVKEDKCGAKVPEDAEIEIRENKLPYVSRGGLKLEKAMNAFNLSVEGAVCIDVGASTGGFTDCMLQRGAKKVFAIDVGHGQLDWRLRNNSQVVVMEKTNIRYLKPEDLSEQVDFATMDVSFISLRLTMEPLKRLLKDDFEGVFLIKPQFEAGRDKVQKNGVVRSPETHIEVINDIVRYAAEIGMYPYHLTYSPVKGPKGNIEYLLHVTSEVKKVAFYIESIVQQAFQNLNESVME